MVEEKADEKVEGATQNRMSWGSDSDYVRRRRHSTRQTQWGLWLESGGWRGWCRERCWETKKLNQVNKCVVEALGHKGNVVRRSPAGERKDRVEHQDKARGDNEGRGEG
ncbi:uncharacterized protein SPSK_03753 [Sporothrix schenckii 1099-18]|uniref:Uncharacterized protein n=1 Tax=Sporothrix schenckii 1099-18 TaxID=1397361 RepID=A0A0F2LZV7_SPOSC|nr:uncharacterized protein SPSK_03753 [Sporothrix schenckii 1099-18]KJR82384.1 hypothetical protein SPSK_03753 [Sporothrix schenckii 1099-18]